MDLTIKRDKRNLQPIYDDILKCYQNGTVNEIKTLSLEFIGELRIGKVKAYEFTNKVNKTMTKDGLILFITNIHM